MTYTPEQVARMRQAATAAEKHAAERKRLAALEYKHGAEIRQCARNVLEALGGPMSTTALAAAIGSMHPEYEPRLIFNVLGRAHKSANMRGYWSRGPAQENKFGRIVRPFMWQRQT